MRETDEAMQRLNYETVEKFNHGTTRLPPDDTLMAAFEQQVGVLLPLHYRYFLSQYGGGSVRNVIIHTALEHEHLMSVEGLHMDMSVLGFYSGPESVWDLRIMYPILKEGLPPGLVPFAEVCDRYYFCISCAPETHGQVFVKAPEEFDDDESVDFLFPQSASLLDFLRELRCLTDEEVQEWNAHCDRTGSYPEPLWTDTFMPDL